MSKAKKILAVVPFAHLLGIHAGSEQDDQGDETEKARRAEKRDEWAKKAEKDDDRKQKGDESDDEYAERMEDMDDAEAEDATDEEDEKAKAVRHSERTRCAKIIAAGIKLDAVQQAGVLAFNSNLKTSEALAVLSASKLDGGGSTKNSLASRMSKISVTHIGPNQIEQTDVSTPQGKSTAMARAIVSAANKARGLTG